MDQAKQCTTDIVHHQLQHALINGINIYLYQAFQLVIYISYHQLQYAPINGIYMYLYQAFSVRVSLKQK